MDRILDALQAKHRFRDPLYGYIYLTDDEKSIIDTPIFQRLRRVHQLALTKYVYPSAEHSRFVHSLGVVHSATAMLAGLFSNARTTISSATLHNHARILRFAALLHDIGHLPFSHAAEKQWLNGLSHEDISQYIILNHGAIREAIEHSDINPEQVAALLSNRYKARHRLLHEIVSGQLDADRADYLLRDSYCCGVKYGVYDFTRYTKIFCAIELSKNFALAVEERDLHVAEAFLLARYHYTLQVPFHRTRKAYDCLLGKFLTDEKPTPFFETDNGRLKSVNLDEFTYLDDYSMFHIFKERAKAGNAWARMLLRDGHLKPLLDITSSNGSEGVESYKGTVQLLSDNGFASGEDFFEMDNGVELIKWADASQGSNLDNDNTVRVLLNGGRDGSPRFVDICEHSWVFRHLKQTPPRIYRIFVRPERYGEAKAILLKALPAGGEYK